MHEFEAFCQMTFPVSSSAQSTMPVAVRANTFASWMEDNITAEVYPELNTAISRVKSAQNAMTADGRPAKALPFCQARGHGFPLRAEDAWDATH